ncbi:MAG TPA: type II toxin-antitoxin system Phd/YefM family antitoxin [Anaerolineae bacterium]|nr:type II toxin-antitoxin system Phd/YefM family antitoxin [Anaerolineae bacterium]HNU04238.1 type II toxin-antitoxin system Phd/YefM family antitoxin [Anaerolineae bacterium]
MPTKTIRSTEIQNNFGRILDDVVHNSTRYVIQRHSSSQAILLSLEDFNRLLAASEGERSKFGSVIRELSPSYDLGKILSE